VIRADECRFSLQRRIEPDDEEFSRISHMWSDALRLAFSSLPDIGED
jgi:putative proteasome-type protease